MHHLFYCQMTVNYWKKIFWMTNKRWYHRPRWDDLIKMRSVEGQSSPVTLVNVDNFANVIGMAAIQLECIVDVHPLDTRCVVTWKELPSKELIIIIIIIIIIIKIYPSFVHVKFDLSCQRHTCLICSFTSHRIWNFVSTLSR